jgi:hypothetical protein
MSPLRAMKAMTMVAAVKRALLNAIIWRKDA